MTFIQHSITPDFCFISFELIFEFLSLFPEPFFFFFIKCCPSYLTSRMASISSVSSFQSLSCERFYQISNRSFQFFKVKFCQPLSRQYNKYIITVTQAPLIILSHTITYYLHTLLLITYYYVITLTYFLLLQHTFLKPSITLQNI